MATSQRVVIDPRTAERRDALDQKWSSFLAECGILPLLIPNHVETARALLDRFAPAGVLLTGGNDLVAYGGDAPERDATESLLLDWAIARKAPLLGVCRGMQVLQHHFKIPLRKVSGHVAAEQSLLVEGVRATRNSFHCFGATQTLEPLETWAAADDGVVKAVRHRTEKLKGIMWHPERRDPFDRDDVEWIRKWFQC